MKRRLISVILIIVLMIGVNGCMRIGKTGIEDKMVAYMNEKYPDDVFAYKEAFGGGAGISTKKIIVSSESYPDADIYVMCVKNDDGSYKYSDNYVGVKYSKQTEELLNNILTEVFGSDFFLAYDVSMYAHPKNDSNYTTFEEYIGDYSSRVGFTAVIGDSYEIGNKEEITSELEKLIVNKGLCCYIGNIYFDNTSEAYKELSDTNLSAYISKKNYKEKFEFEMETNSEFYKFEWSE